MNIETLEAKYITLGLQLKQAYDTWEKLRDSEDYVIKEVVENAREFMANYATKYAYILVSKGFLNDLAMNRLDIELYSISNTHENNNKFLHNIAKVYSKENGHITEEMFDYYEVSKLIGEIVSKRIEEMSKKISIIKKERITNDLVIWHLSNKDSIVLTNRVLEELHNGNVSELVTIHGNDHLFVYYNLDRENSDDLYEVDYLEKVN